jgi:hypothetical protein
VLGHAVVNRYDILKKEKYEKSFIDLKKIRKNTIRERERERGGRENRRWRGSGGSERVLYLLTLDSKFFIFFLT